MDKIRYRLVYNRKKKLNKQGTALVQVECSLNGRKIYLTTNVYLRPECWDKEVSQVCNHPQALDLNAMLYEYILKLHSPARQAVAVLQVAEDRLRDKDTAVPAVRRQGSCYP